jgi:hypothetical protein
MFGQIRVQKLIKPACDLERRWIEVCRGLARNALRGLPSNAEANFSFKAPGHSPPSGCNA